MNRLICTFLVCCSFISGAHDQVQQQMRVGNLALPTSQQPGPLFSFGQNIVDAGDAQVYGTVYDQDGVCSTALSVVPSFLYGFTDTLSLFITVPFAAYYKNQTSCSSGISDITVQFEYAWYTKDTEISSDLITLVVNGSMPSGSLVKQPPTGAGSPSAFLGISFGHIDCDWYLFSTQGFQVFHEYDGTKMGNNYVFQAGVAKNIAYSSSHWILSLMLEIFGTYSWYDIYNGVCNPNSGGATLFCGPSLWFSTDCLIIQAGISGPLAQQLNGSQPKLGYFAELDIGWKF